MKAVVERRSFDAVAGARLPGMSLPKTARQMLTMADERSLGCPGPMELAPRQGDYAAFAELARIRCDAVHFLAGLVAGGNG